MGWLNRLFGRQPTAPAISPEEQKKLDDAFAFGQRAASSMAADLDAFVALRFGHLKQAFQDILISKMNEDLERKDHSPLLLARADFSEYIRQIGETGDKMLSEIMEAMEEWRKVFELIDEEENQVSDWRKRGSPTGSWTCRQAGSRSSSTEPMSLRPSTIYGASRIKTKLHESLSNPEKLELAP